jgi:hypothetical protein
MATENYFNNYPVTLGANMTNVATTLTASAAAPIAGGFRILIGVELMLVTSGGTTTTWTVTRGVEGTSAVPHNSGDTISVVLTAGAFDNVRTQINGTGTYANLPASGMKSGDTWTPTDAPYRFIFDGSLWVPYGSLQDHQVTLPPSAGWSWQNQGPATVTQTNGTIVMQVTGNNGRNLRQYVRAYPTPPFTLTACLSFLSEIPLSGAGDDYGGLVITDGTGIVANVIGFFTGYTGYCAVSLTYFTNATTFSGTQPFSIQAPNLMYSLSKIWMRIVDDNVNLTCYLSQDGITFQQVGSSVGRTAFLTPSNIGLTVDKNVTNLKMTMTCHSWNVA